MTTDSKFSKTDRLVLEGEAVDIAGGLDVFAELREDHALSPAHCAKGTVLFAVGEIHAALVARRSALEAWSKGKLM